MTQKIKRSDLKVIYDNVCQDWKNIITDMLLWNVESSIEIEEETILKGYNQANSEQKVLLEKYFKINKPINLIEKIKTWKDVLKYAKEKGYTFNLPYPEKTKVKEEISLNALCKIHLLAKVFNENWVADFNNSNQYKYYPWFEKKSSGWVFDVADYLRSNSSGWGSFSYFKNSDIVNYIGNNQEFINIYNEYLQ